MNEQQLHAVDCPLLGCQTCQQQSSVMRLDPPALGRERHQDGHVTDQAVHEVRVWLEVRAREAGWIRSDVHRGWCALWLIQFRDRFEAGRWGWG